MKIKFLTKVWPCLPLPPLSYCPTLPAKKSFPASEPLHRQPLAPARILLHYLKIGSLLSAEMPLPQPEKPSWACFCCPPGLFLHCTYFNLQQNTHVFIYLFTVFLPHRAILFTAISAGSRQCLAHRLSIFFSFLNKLTHPYWTFKLFPNFSSHS